MPALGFFVCNGCGTVYADLEEPPRCHRCGDSVDELGPETQAFDYFAGR